MATPSGTPTPPPAPPAPPASKFQKFADWSKRWGVRILIVGMALFLLVPLVQKQWPTSQGSASSSSGGEWQFVMTASCQPNWHHGSGWCEIGEVPQGTYRIVPTYDFWQRKLLPSNPPQATDKPYVLIPPEGVNIMTWDNKSFRNEFLTTAPVKSYNYGALIARVNGKNLEVLSQGVPKEFTVDKKGTKIFLNVNLPAQLLNYTGNLGELTVQLEKRSTE